MPSIDEIRQGLRALCAGPINTVVATVKSVDEEALSMVCTPVGEGADYEDVRLKASISSEESGLYVVPKKGTSVLLGIINNDPDTTYLHTAEAVDKIIAIAGNSSIKISNDKIEMNGGALGGLIKIEALVSYLQTIDTWTQKLKQVIDVSSYPTAATGAPDTFHAALKTVIDPIGSTSISQVAIEDTKITH